MNLRASAILLRPRTLAESLDLACRLCVTLAAGVYARLAAWMLLPVFAGCLALRYAAGWPWAAVWAIAVAAGGVVQGVFTVAVGQLLFSEETGAARVLRLFGRRAGSYLVTLLITRVLLVLSCVLFFLGPLFVWPRVLFVHEANLLEGAAPVPAMRRSGRVVAGRAVAAFGALLALLLIQAAFVAAGELLGQGLVADLLQLGAPFGSLRADGGSPYALAGLLLSVPYVATARFLAYVDLRTRADGWDIQLRFMAIAAGEGARREAA